MKLYDAYGREVETARLRDEQAAPTLTGVRNIFSGMHPTAGLTPERLAAILRESEFGDPYVYLELAEEMEEKDLHYLAVLGTRKQTLAGCELVIEPASAAAADLRAAALVRKMLLGGALEIESALFDLADAIGKGFAVLEIIWDTAGREWTPRRLKWRDPRWFVFDWSSGEELLVRTLDDGHPKPQAAGEHAAAHFSGQGMSPAYRRGIGIQPLTARLVPYKFVTHVAKAKSGLPVRGGVARAAGWSYLFKNYVLKDWLTFTEVFGQPLRVGKYHPGATDADKRTLLAAVANIGTDAAAIIPESMMIEFTEARQGSSSELYLSFCEYLDAQVSKAVLGQTLTTETARQGGGSRAAAQVHDAVRRDILAADARRMEATLNRDLVRPIVDLNLGPRARYPKASISLPSDTEIRTFADIVAQLADRGLRIGQRAVLERLGIAEPRDGEPVLQAASAARRG